MGISMIESTDFEMRPLRTVHVPCRSASMNKRGKVFSVTPPVDESTAAYMSCQECTSSVDDVAKLEGPVPVPLSAGDDSVDGDAVAPTADDFANIFFCASSEEDALRASLTAPSEVSSTTSSTSSASRREGGKKRRRGVSFGASIPTFHDLHDVPPAHAMTPEEKSAQWFSRCDLDSLKSRAQCSIQDMRGRVVGNLAEYKDRSKFRAMMATMERETGSSIRGLEHRVFRRKQTRQMLIRDVLNCQRHVQGLANYGHSMDAKETSMLLAKVSTERSAKARAVALVDAKSDYKEVYCNSEDDAADERQMRKRQKQARQVSMESATCINLM